MRYHKKSSNRQLRQDATSWRQCSLHRPDQHSTENDRTTQQAIVQRAVFIYEQQQAALTLADKVKAVAASARRLQEEEGEGSKEVEEEEAKGREMNTADEEDEEERWKERSFIASRCVSGQLEQHLPYLHCRLYLTAYKCRYRRCSCKKRNIHFCSPTSILSHPSRLEAVSKKP